MPQRGCEFGTRKDLSHHGLLAKHTKTLHAVVDGVLNVPAAEAVAQTIGRERALEHLHGETLLRSKNGHNVIKARDLRLPSAAPKKKSSGKSNWPSTPTARAQLQSRCAERKALGIPKRVGVAEAYEAVHWLRKAVASALNVELEKVPPRAVVRMMDRTKGGALLKPKPPGRKVVRVAIHENTPLVALLTADEDPALPVKNRLMQPGTAQLIARRHVRYEAAGDFMRTIDFFIGGDAQEEELPRDADESDESEADEEAEEAEEQAESGDSDDGEE